MFARVPESMWSMRCEIGWPIVTLVPGSSETFCRSSSSTVSRGRSFISSRTSISADSTPCTCSSSSALPVRRAVEVTSGTLSISRSRALPSAFESARLVPGNRHGADGQGAFVELREKRSARRNDAHERSHQQSDGSGQNGPPVA